MKEYKCPECGYVYDSSIGDPENDIEPKTPFENLPDDWECPECFSVEKNKFIKIRKKQRELLDLEIHENEIMKLTGILKDYSYQYYESKQKDKTINSIKNNRRKKSLIFMLVLTTISLFSYPIVGSIGLLVALIISSIIVIVVSGKFWSTDYWALRNEIEYRLKNLEQGLWRKYIQEKVKRLSRLIEEVDKYNQVVSEMVSHITVIDQLEEVGNPIKVENREHILSAFKKIRENLVQALKTERILRENPNFKPETFTVDAIPLFQTLEFGEYTKECERFVNQALEIGVHIQEVMKSL